MIGVDRMRLGGLEFSVESATFRRVTQSWSGPGWDFTFTGRRLHDESEEAMFLRGVVVYAEAAPLPLASADDYTGVELDLPGEYDGVTGEPYFAIDVGESYNASGVRLKFVGREGKRYLIEVTGVAPGIFSEAPGRFELKAWAEEMPDHAYPV